MSVQMNVRLVSDTGVFERDMRESARLVRDVSAQITRSMGGAAGAAKASAGAYEQLRASIDPAFASAQRYAEVQRRISGFVEAGTIDQRQANMVLEQAAAKYMGVVTAAQRKAIAERDAAMSTEVAKRSYESLRASIDPLYAASKRYEVALETLDAAMKAGVITDQDRARTLKLLESTMLSTNQATGMAGAGIGKFGMVANQVGYQIQDVFVSGPIIGWFRAIAQQAPQAAGAFAMLGGRIGAILPWIGTAVAIGAAFIPILGDFGSKAKALDEIIDDLNSTLGDFERYAEKARGTSEALFDEFGRGAERGRALYESLAMLERIKFEQALTASVASLRDSLAGVTDLMEQWDYATLRMSQTVFADALVVAGEAAQKLTKDYGLTLAQARQLTDAMSDVRMAKGPEQAAIATGALARVLLDAHLAGANLPPELLAAARAAAETGIAAERMNAILNDSLGVGSQIASEFDRLAASIGYAAASAAQLAAQLGAAAVVGAKQAERQLAVINAQISAVKSGADEIVAGQVKSLELDKAAFRNAQLAAGVDAGIVESMVKRNFAAQEAVIYANQELQSTIKIRTENERAAKSSGGGKGRAAASEKAAKALAKEAQRWENLLDPVAKYNREMYELLQLQDQLSPDIYAKAQERLNDQLADSIPLVGDLSDAWADFVMSGGKDISSLGDLFKSTLHQMVADAAKQQIMLSMGIIPSGTAPGATGTTGTGGLFGLGNLISPESWLGKGLSSGKGLLGGLGKMLGMGSGGTAGATGLLGKLGGWLGTAGAIIGGIGLVISLGKKLFGRELKDVGVTGQFTGDSFSGSSYKYYKGGLFRSSKTIYADLGDDVQAVIGAAYGELRGSIRDMAGVLDLGSGAIRDFAYKFSLSTKDMTEDQILEALQDEMAKAGAGMAELVLGTDAYTRAGESALDVLTRLSTSLAGVRDVADLLGHSFDVAGLKGGALASHLADAFGGLDAMGGAVQTYWQAVYSEEERLATMSRQASAALAALGLQMPRSRDEYRRMVDALDLSQESTHELYAALIGMAGVMDQVLPSVSGLTAALAALQGNVSTEIDAMIAATTSAQQQALDAAKTWYAAAASIREYIDKLRGTAGALVSAGQARAYNEARYQTLLARAMAGDAGAVSDITGAADAMLGSVRDTARTRVDLARAQARVLSDMGLLQGVADIEGARHDVIAGLLGQQVDVLTEVRDFLAGGGVLDEALIDQLNGQLGGLQDAIAAAELINYNFLRERLAVTVDVIADADIPESLRVLLTNATDGITGHVDFIARSDLTPDQKWLAMTGASQHVKTIDYLAKNTLGAGLTKLALADVSKLTKTVDMLVGSTLPADVVTLALAGNSELARIVTATLAAGISPEAKRLALGNIGAYAVTVNAALAAKLPEGIQRLVVAQQGSYAAMIEGAISADITDRARRILLKQQGGYIANISGIIDAELPANIRRLLLNANTAGARAVTISAVFAEALTPAQRAALLATSDTISKTILGAVQIGKLTDVQRRLLLEAGTTVTRTIKGGVDLTGLTARQKALLDAISGAGAGKITLGGSFTFDASTGFAAWYEATTKAGIASPITQLRAGMSTLQVAMGDLRKAVAAETARAARAATVGQLNGYVGALTANAEGNHFVDDADLAAMAKIIGLDTAGLTAAQIRNRLVNYDGGDLLRGTIYDPDGKKEQRYLDSLKPKNPIKKYSLSDYTLSEGEMPGGGGKPRVTITGPLGGVRLLNDTRMAGAEAWLAAQGYPAFAAGGDHLGGLRLVGEQGPELEATGPSRIYNASQTRDLLQRDDGAMLEELRALRREVAAARSENTQLLLRIEGYERQQSRIARDWDANGLPAERTA